jgi:hypothetical protein
MTIAAWLESALAQSRDWRGELQRHREDMTAPGAQPDADRVLDLAGALEQVEPDRRSAFSLYQAAYRGGNDRAREALLALAAELRAHVTLSELAREQHQVTQDPQALLAAARHLVDAGLLEQALAMFADAIKQHPSLAETLTTSPRLGDVRYAVAKSHMRTLDAEREVDSCLARARQDPADAAAAFVVGARIARLAGSPRYAKIVAEGAAACPDSAELARLHEDLELEGATPDALLAYYAKRLEAARGEQAWIETARAAAFELILRDANPGLGLRLLRTSLEHAYAANLPGVMRRHLASWELLLSGARATQSTVALLPLLRAALDAELPDLAATFISQLGLQIAWRDASDVDAARPFAARLTRLVPSHSLAAEFAAVAGASEPVLPTVTFRIPKVAAPVAQRAPRAVVPLDVVIELPTGGFFSAVLRDVSVSGAFVATKRALEVGSLLSLEIKVPSGRDLETRTLRTDATVARRTELGCGLQFVSPPAQLVAGIEALLAKAV